MWTFSDVSQTGYFSTLRQMQHELLDPALPDIDRLIRAEELENFDANVQHVRRLLNSYSDIIMDRRSTVSNREAALVRYNEIKDKLLDPDSTFELIAELGQNYLPFDFITNDIDI